MTNRKYILEAIINRNSISSDGYYTGKSIIYQGDRYATVSYDITEAKIYSSESRAKKASEMCFENYTFQLVPLDE
ncbi:hypothetical protein [Clostridium akagii]|uniref:hypothetical protein n=1 Tax=Clostridium akagii TaxID=91623 RepID=UPI00047872C5|nr:hypothetical protein [Clostridium akagii]